MTRRFAALTTFLLALLILMSPAAHAALKATIKINAPDCAGSATFESDAMDVLWYEITLTYDDITFYQKLRVKQDESFTIQADFFTLEVTELDIGKTGGTAKHTFTFKNGKTKVVRAKFKKDD